MHARLCAAVAVVFALVPMGAQAGPIPGDVTVSMNVAQSGGSWSASSTWLDNNVDATTTGDITTAALMSSSSVLGGDATFQDWNLTFDRDPFITNNFVVVNNSGLTQTYTVAVSGIIPAFAADTIVQSNIILSINDDDNAGGATVSSIVSTPVYDAFVNGTSELTFLGDPFSNSCATPVDCALNGTSVGAVASQAFGPVVATSIGITVTFDLSAGDSAAVQSRFEIVPEPGTAMLLGTGLVGMAARQRRIRRA